MWWVSDCAGGVSDPWCACIAQARHRKLLPLDPAQPPHPAGLQPPPAAATLPNPHPAPLPPPLPGTIEFPEFLRMFKDELLDLNEVRTLTLMAALLGCKQRWFKDWAPVAY